MTEVYVERQDNRILVNWGECSSGEFRVKLAAIKTVPGRRWLKNHEGRPWSVPLDMTVCRLLRIGFGDDLRIGPALREWARQAVTAEERLGSISAATSGVLRRLPSELPTLYRALYLGPLGKIATAKGAKPEEVEAFSKVMAAVGIPGSYQTADVRFLTDSPAPLNANHQGLGKTLEAIAEVWEAGRQVGNHLVICPKGAVRSVWEPELLRWQQDARHNVSVHACMGSKSQKTAALMEFTLSTADVKWLVVNPEGVRYERDETNTGKVALRAKPKDRDKACMCDRLVDPHWHYRTRFPVIGNTQWNTVINDETHKGNIRNHRTITSISVNGLSLAPDGKRVAMSGTPMKGKGADIWGTLHYLRPDVFTSYWNFVDMFFEVLENDYGKTVGKLLEQREREFYRYLTPYVLRRTKEECTPWLPAKNHIPVMVQLEGKQLKQYQQMEQELCAWLSEHDSVSASSTVAQYVRLQQFAGAYHERGESGDLVPTRTSAKLDALWEKLEEAGVLDGSCEMGHLIFSQSRKMVEMVNRTLLDAGVASEIISGKNVNTRHDVVKRFQAGETAVLCIVTTAGGVALTLDRADTEHFLDETWAPDDQEQAEDRAHRATSTHQVTIYLYRAEGTIDETKVEEAGAKRTQHQRILDVRRRLLDEKEKA